MLESSRILIIGGCEEDTRILNKQLNNDQDAELFDIVHVEESHAKESLMNDPFDLVILSFCADVVDPVQVFKSYIESIPDIPFIVIGEDDDDTLAPALIQLGAQHFLKRDWINESIRQMIRNIIIRFRLKGDYQSVQQSMYHLVSENPDGIIVLDGTQSILFYNEAAQKLFNDTLRLNEHFPYSMPDHSSGVITLERENHAKVYLEMRVQKILWKRHDALILSFRDITSHTKALSKVKHLNKLMRAHSEIITLISSQSDPLILARDVCHIMIQTAGFKTAWLALTDAQKHIIHTVMAPETSHYSFPHNQPLPSTCFPMDLKSPMVRLYDHKDHDAGCPFSQLASIGEIALTRIQNMDTIFGLLIVTRNKGQIFLEEDKELLSIIANHVSVAFKAIRTLEKSRKNELKYSQLVKTISSGVAVYRTENDGETFIFEDINPSGERICHMKREDLIGKNVEEVFPSIIEAGLLDAFRGVYKTHQSVLVPTTLYKGKELSLWIENRVYALSDGRIAAVFEDKTDDKKDEWEKDMLVQAIEQANETVMITDTKGDIFYVNAAFEKTTGYTRREAYGQNTRILKSGKHDESFYINLWETISSGRTWKGRIINKRKDGGIFVEDASISPIFDELGLIVNYVAVKMDITDNLNLIEDKSKLEKILQQSQKLESIGRLAGGVAHDFNNMLSIILGYGSSIMKELRKEDPLYESMTQVINAAKKSAALTRQLLAFSRKQELSPEIVNLNELITNLQKMLGRLIPENIQMKLDLCKYLGNTKVDPGQIEQIIVNLVVNARDAIGQEGGKLKISTQNINLNPSDKIVGIIANRAPYVLIKIKDTGCGMDEKTMQQVYEPFFTTKKVGKGTGLGLSTVFGIVKQHNGYIWVKSKRGRGTTFFIALPLVSEMRDKTEKKTEEFDYAGHNEVILVVEDEKPIRLLIKKLLTQIGYLVETAANSGEALIMIHEQGLRPHLIVTDVIMPGISGRELLDHLMKHEGLHFKALLMSGYSEEILSKKALLPRETWFMKKPFTEEELAKTVYKALHGPEPVTSSTS